MFYEVQLTKSLEMHPRTFGPNLRATIEEKLKAEVEGTCSGKYGFVIFVTKIVAISKGLIRADSSGFATFNVGYMCIVFRPFKNEVLDCVVTSVNKMGFFAEAGPLQTFVSAHLIPEEYEFNLTGEPCFVSQDESTRIQEGTEVRLRVVGIRMDASEIFCIGTIRDDYLGVIGGNYVR